MYINEYILCSKTVDYFSLRVTYVGILGYVVVWINGQPDHNRNFGLSLVLFSTVGTYVEWYYIGNFSAKKCQHSEGTGCTLWSVMVLYNSLKGFPSVPCWQG